jgi:hypothetical protein
MESNAKARHADSGPLHSGDVVFRDKFSWPTHGPNVGQTFGSTMRRRDGVETKRACK